MLDFLTSSMSGKLPEWISAFGAVSSMIGVWFLWGQLNLTKKITQLQFEDSLAKEYRDIASRIPTKALLGSGLSPREYELAFDELFLYIDLSNEQIDLRRRDRISGGTWINWSAGIQFNLQLSAFSRAWSEVQKRNPTQFRELQLLVKDNFQTDPKKWRDPA